MGSIPGNEKSVIMKEDEACSFAMTITSGSVLPMVLNTVIELNVLEIIKKAGPGALLSSTQIAAQLSTKKPNAITMLDRMLRLLASHSIVSCTTKIVRVSNELVDVERRYGVSPVCRFLTKDEDGVTLGALSLVLQDKLIMESW